MSKLFAPILTVIFVLISVTGAGAASPRPVWAPHGMVSSADSLATEVGLKVLKDGGNAVDAAAAVAAALGVTESYSSGIGGGCFVLIRMADGTAAALDGRETAPARATRLMYVPRDTTKTSTLSTEGVLAVATPGELAALDLAVRTYGKRTLARDLEGAIALADTGFMLNRRYERALKTSKDLLSRFEGPRRIFFKNGSTPFGFGDRLVQTDLANTLRRVQTEGISAFYTGEIPSKVAAYMQKNGGILSADDFLHYKPVVRQPVRGSYDGLEILLHAATQQRRDSCHPDARSAQAL